MLAENLKTIGATLIKNGYLVVPIKPGEKRPAIKDWEHSRLTINDCTAFGNCGAGILCGQGDYPIAAFDIDTNNVALAKEFSEWCFDNLGPACERIGNAPKLLLVYRAAQSGLRKSTGAWFSDTSGSRHRLEVLGHGQQFVAYHIHPDTKQPYRWVDLFGGLVALGAAYLTIVSQEQIAQALQVFEELAVKHGLTRVAGSTNTLGHTAPSEVLDDPLSYTQRTDITLDEAKALVEHLDSQDYDTWISVGMVLHFEFEGSNEALALWDAWSATAGNYKSFEDLNFRWQGFKSDGAVVKGAAWLRKAARESQKAALRDAQQGALEEISALIQRCTSPIDLIGDVAEKVGVLSCGSDGLRAIAEGELRSKFKELTGTSLLVADVRKALNKGRVAARGAAKRHPDTEIGNARRMIDRHGGELLFAKDTRQWFGWRTVYWQTLHEADVKGVAIDTVMALVDELRLVNDQDRQNFFNFCKLSQREPTIKHIMSLAQADKRIGIESSELDKNVHLLGVRNGAINLRTGTLVTPDPKNLITAVSATEFDPKAKCPLFEQTLLEVFKDDAEMVSFFKRVVGYSLLGDPVEQVMVMPYGSGANGKSTVLNTIRDVLGDYAAATGSGTFLGNGFSNGYSAIKPELLALRGKRLIYVDEPDEGAVLKEDIVKSITGGDSVTARAPHSGAMITFKPTGVVFMPTNHKPTVKSDSYAIWRRILLIPFTRNFDKDPTATKDPDRSKKLKAEYPGILAWCVQGALEYQKLGLNPPEEVRKAVDEYRQDMDLLKDWMDDCCELDSRHAESTAKLWASWQAYARDKGGFSCISSSQAFSRKLSAKDFLTPVRHVGEERGRGFIGIKVKTVGDF